MADTTALSASARGASFLILVQIASKALTFTLTQLLLRRLSPALLGASVHLELYKIATLYFSRESLRVATERRSGGGVQAAINLSYLAILAGVPVGSGIAWLWTRGGVPDVPFLVEGLRVNGLAALVELAMEPAFVAVQQRMLYKVRAAAEVPGVMVKTFVTAGLVLWSRREGIDLGVLPFAVGELANSSTMAVIYIYQTSRVAKRENFSLLPKRLESSPQTEEYALSYFSKPLLRLTASLYFQTAIKWALTEGDKLLVAAFASLEAQGMYALSANYGGFLARMIFKPIEESSRNLFANLCTAPPAPTPSKDKKGKAKQDENTQDAPNQNILAAQTTLSTLLKTYTTLSLPLFALGPSLAPFLLKLVAGTRWSASGAGEVLGTYCYYIPFLAINGVSEAFVAATADSKDLRRQSVWMTGFSVVFAGSAWLFLQKLGWGAKGLVVANCVNMGLRIVFNLGFVREWFGRHGVDIDVGGILPSMYAVAAAAVVPSIVSRTEGLAMLEPYGVLGEFVRIGAFGAVLVALIAVTERVFILDCYKRFRL